MNKTNPLIIALDVETFDEAKKLVESLGDSVDIYKVGSQLFTAYGPEVIKYLERQGKKVFLDLKFHDIPNTVAKAVESAVGLGVFMLTIHTQGGKEMMEAAAAAARKKSPRPLVVGVTVLTSDTETVATSQTVLQRARLALASGLDGVVASPQEVVLLRRELGPNFIIVTPGIRPASASADDQKRIATPKDAIKSGSNYLVVGRPVVKAADPRQAAQNILSEIRNVK